MSAQVDTLQNNQVLNFESIPYWQAYGLHQDPFAMEIDPRMYYASPHWEEYIDLLQYLGHYNNDLLVRRPCSRQQSPVRPEQESREYPLEHGPKPLGQEQTLPVYQPRWPRFHSSNHSRL